MKKFIALGVALAVLLFGFVPAMNTVENEVKVCSDLPIDPDPYDQILS